MGIRTTVELDEDVFQAVTDKSGRRGESIETTLNDLLRTALTRAHSGRVPFEIKPLSMGYKPDLSYNCIESLLDYGEGESHR